MSFQTIITNIGAARLAAAIQGGGIVNLSHMALGDGGGNVTIPSASQTALVREVYRAELNYLTRSEQNPNYVIAEMVVPSTVGGWSVREVGLYDNGGSLIAVGNFPETYKPQLSEGSARDLVVRVIIEVSTEAIVALQIDPSAVLATRQWVDDNFTLRVMLPGGTTGQILRKRSNQDGDFEWYDPLSGMNILVDVVEENQSLAASQTVVDLAIATMVSTGVYVDGVRLRNDGTQYTMDSDTRITLATPAAGGEKITFVQNEPAGSAEFLRIGNNLSELSTPARAAEARQNLGVGTPQELEMLINKNRYPIGEIYISNLNIHPKDRFGFGEWVRHHPGRMPVSLDPNDATFSVLGATGGAKTHTLTSNEMPIHLHVNPEQRVKTSSNGEHAHPIDGYRNKDGADRSPEIIIDNGRENTIVTRITGTAPAHVHDVVIPKSNSGAAGGGQPHNNLPPFFVANIWRRVA